jgi:hypothetical protein
LLIVEVTLRVVARGAHRPEIAGIVVMAGVALGWDDVADDEADPPRDEAALPRVVGLDPAIGAADLAAVAVASTDALPSPTP